jgi:hypothetical protein
MGYPVSVTKYVAMTRVGLSATNFSVAQHYSPRMTSVTTLSDQKNERGHFIDLPNVTLYFPVDILGFSGLAKQSDSYPHV